MSFVLPQRNQALVIRRARAADAAPIARVHVQSWREAYRGLVPDVYLDQLSVAAHERQWRRSFAAGTWAFVAEWEQRVVGFASGGLSRARRDISGELHLLYVLRASHRHGIGRALFDACHYELARCGHRGHAGLGAGRQPAAALLRAARRRARRRELGDDRRRQAARGRLRVARLSRPLS